MRSREIDRQRQRGRETNRQTYRDRETERKRKRERERMGWMMVWKQGNTETDAKTQRQILRQM